METFEHYGTYSIRNIGKCEQGIHMPSTISGKYSIYVNEDASTIVLRKELPFKTDKFLKDCEKWEKEPTITLEEAKEVLGAI